MQPPGNEGGTQTPPPYSFDGSEAAAFQEELQTCKFQPRLGRPVSVRNIPDSSSHVTNLSSIGKNM
ncbi:hypothetical protein DSO57_1030912 [Entomophthora muscae]|uniref:Uncharacterized protein n=1 Tax=Entomophthora muscae TaxID=34485 RepID=A0ACC2S2P0_9FUNG|nr:hypothetical protein DSO57_1030912 [Entomophthora muscae]